MKSDFNLWNTITAITVLIIAILLKDYHQFSNQLANEATKLNNTIKANRTVLVFNRTPKAGSESLWKLIDILANQNNFLSMSDSQELKKKRGENTILKTKEQREYYVNGILAHEDVNTTLPITYTKHINFIDFEEFNFTNPIYINMVRHPVERVISWYYYIRQGWYILDVNSKNETELADRKMHEPKWFKTPFEECFLEKLPECSYPLGEYIGGSHTSQVILFFIFNDDVIIFVI